MHSVNLTVEIGGFTVIAECTRHSLQIRSVKKNSSLVYFSLPYTWMVQVLESENTVTIVMAWPHKSAISTLSTEACCQKPMSFLSSLFQGVPLPQRKGVEKIRLNVASGKRSDELLASAEEGTEGHEKPSDWCKKLRSMCGLKNRELSKSDLKGKEDGLNRWVAIINPNSGSKTGPSEFKDNILPTLTEVGLTVTSVMTKQPGHAVEIAKRMTTRNDVDGIICVGGDGLVGEVVNGIMLADGRRVPLAIVPAGSDNATACDCGGRSCGANRIMAMHIATIAIIKGTAVRMDIADVLAQKRNKTKTSSDEWQQPFRVGYCSTVLAWGFPVHVLKDTINHRWMGPIRTTWCGVKAVIRPPPHVHGRISWVPKEGVRGLCEFRQGKGNCRCVTGPDTISDAASRTASHPDSTFMACVVLPHPNNLLSAPSDSGSGAPDGHLSDQCLDMFAVPQVSWFRNFNWTTKMAFCGQHTSEPYVTYVKTSEVYIDRTSDASLPFGPFNLDGELVQPDADRIIVKLIPRAVEVMCAKTKF
eukprot:m.101216 g.101216  ORF g.101216 m.101216 type:complete len:530 (-) comp13736_c2_seq1:2185-3774(-)